MLYKIVQHSSNRETTTSNCFTCWMVGLQRIIERQNKVVITDRMWARLLSSTNQPSFLSPEDIIEDKKEEAPQSQLLNGESGRDDEAFEKVISNAC